MSATGDAQAGAILDLSLNEVEMMALKAARGAGLSWGLAEDAGRAARWLAQAGFGWSSSLLDLLALPATIDPAASPLVLAAEIGDRPAAAGGLRRLSVVLPVWAVPGVALAAHDRPIRLAVGTEAVLFRGGEVTASAPLAAIGEIATAEISVEIPADAAPLAFAWSPRASRSLVPPADHAALDVLVYKTYVPASERSRLRGAGGRP